MNKLNHTLASIGVPVYNGSQKIETALHSILTQSYANLEVVISDNASTDNTREICERICAEDERVSYVRQPVNLGPSANFKAVLNLAQGDYFMWLGHDDWLSEKYIEVCAKTLNENSDVSLACGQAIYCRDGNEVFRGAVVQLQQESPRERVAAYFDTVSDNGMFYGLMRRELLAKVKMNDVMGGDWLMIASIAFMGKVVTLPAISVNRERGGSSASYENIASLLGLSKFQATFPHVAIAFFAFRDIAWRDPVYSLNGLGRLFLGWKCQRRIRLHHDASLCRTLRKCLSLGKQYSKRVIGSAKKLLKNV